MVVLSAQSIAQLWLPWFVHRSDSSRPVTDLAESLNDARQLRVCDLANPDAWHALSQPDPARPSDPSHTDRIDSLAAQLAPANVIAILPVLEVPEGWIVMDGCHRACALWRINPAAVADIVIPPHLDHLVCDPRLRA